MRRQLFITGTGTDVGKTIVTAGVAATALAMGVPTAAFKPIQTGIAEFAPDIDVIRGLVPSLVPVDDDIPRFTFDFPASPHLAARVENAEINPDAVTDAIQRAAKLATVDLLLIEGAGGVLVPIRGEFTMLDLMKRLGVPVVVVADAGLGTLNHTLLTIRALRGEGIDVAGVIMNKFPPSPGEIEQDNLEVIKSLGDVPILALMETFQDVHLHFEKQSDSPFIADKPLRKLIVPNP